MAAKTKATGSENGKPKAAERKSIIYIVQREVPRVEAPRDEETDAAVTWQDIGEFAALRATEAMKAAAGEGEKAASGKYRAFPKGNDSRLTVQAEMKTVVTYAEE